MTYNIIFFYLSNFFFVIALFMFFSGALKRKEEWLDYHRQWMIVAAIAGLFSLILRARESGYFPLVTLYEITFFYAFVINVFYIFALKKDTPSIIRGIVLGLVSILLISNFFMDRNIYPLNPLLDSYWLVIHVPAAMLSYSAFALSFAISVYYLLSEKFSWPTGQIAQLNLWLISIGTLLLGICIVTGAVWAKTAWGRYWSWDPKETWALATFIIYGSIFIVKTKKAADQSSLQARLIAVLSIIGFCAMLITFFGVALLMKSHHAYQ